MILAGCIAILEPGKTSFHKNRSTVEKGNFKLKVVQIIDYNFSYPNFARWSHVEKGSPEAQ